MFREMRRKRQLMSECRSIELLKNEKTGVLALLGDDDYPYALPINYVYHDNKIYFHSANSGHKVDAVKKYNKASFCVIGQDEVVPEEYTTYFTSVIVFGKIRILENEAEIRDAVERLAVKYYPDGDETGRNNVIEKDWNRLCMIELSIEYISGKEAIELVKGDENTVGQ